MRCKRRVHGLGTRFILRSARDGQLEFFLVQARNIDLREIRLERFQRTPIAVG